MAMSLGVGTQLLQSDLAELMRIDYVYKSAILIHVIFME